MPVLMNINNRISRRLFLALSGGASLVPPIAWAAGDVPLLLDHVLLGCDDLDRGIDFVAQGVGVRAAVGGVHPGRGTRNALLSLGECVRRAFRLMVRGPARVNGLTASSCNGKPSISRMIETVSSPSSSNGAPIRFIPRRTRLNAAGSLISEDLLQIQMSLRKSLACCSSIYPSPAVTSPHLKPRSLGQRMS